ncbi:MAG TPA: prenyltransferase/squalene oxidase repeat-containing protein [Mycobacteriales bacterium]|nr:prenyltransferase/squalene oxidase repeat-containing protein [Mycobacteriales bacterium]
MRLRAPLNGRLLSTLLAVLMAAALAVAGPAAPASAAAADPLVTQRAAQWLADQLSPQGTVVGSYPGPDGQPVSFTDWGRTLDVALALLAAGGEDEVLGRTLTSVESLTAVREYTQGAPGDRPDAAYAGATAKLAFVVALTGGDPTNVSGIDLIAQLLSLVTPDGRLADRSDFGNYANLFGHAFALLALDTAGRVPPPAMVQALLAAQCPDGSFPQEYQPAAGAACTGQVDATGLVLQALAAIDLGNSQAAQRALNWLSEQQRADGSFPGEAPVNSTGYAVLGFNATDTVPPRNAVAYLTSQQNSDGGLRRGSDASADSDLFATAQALPALAGTFFQQARAIVARQPVPPPSSPPPSSAPPASNPPTTNPTPVTPSPNPGGACGSPATVTAQRNTIVATEAVTVFARSRPGAAVQLFAYSRPSTTFQLVRSGTTDAQGLATFSLRPPTNTRVYAVEVGCPVGPSIVINVRTALTIGVVRNGFRDYTFAGGSFPVRSGGLIISLYRVTPAGQSVLVSQTRASASTGRWSLRRVFTGSGRFGFIVRTGHDLQNAAGASVVRPVVIS